ncbi:MAG: GTP-binding protein [Reyranella sp.]|uniref:CobW family GTP-binding protein n=1 Tax=Reyranella sp. TaxID=1929291 RepID=UPI001AC25FD2|nr:GTP-binding protein [Reyranella sp.]MBN9085980.1 GTP-binding protein [Reyranella sp.]
MTGPAGTDFVVLTGFLGSGKTTLLRDFLTGPEAADTAVIVNEAGEIGLDGVILREDRDTPIAMLSNGCICCTAGSDLAYTIDRLLSVERPGATGPLRRIVLETSGLSKPGPVLRQLGSLAAHRLRVSVLVTFDATRGTALAEFEEASAQWAAAHRIVVTKTDVVSAEAVARAREEIASINPLAEIVATADRDRAVTAAFAPLAGGVPMPAPPPVAAQAHPHIGVRLARPVDVMAYDDVAAWLDNLAGALGDRLLRLKGLVRVKESERPVLVQSVGTIFSAPRPFGEPHASPPLFLVIIARDLRAGELEAVAPVGLFDFSSYTAPASLGSVQRFVGVA